jgi:UDPglucose 6-dehydrogenase
VEKLLGDKVTYAPHQYECLENADALIIATEWSVFRTPDFDKIKATLKNSLIIDGRNLFDVARMQELGFHYESVGRSAAI